MEGGDIDFCGSFPSGVIGDTLANLKAAAEGEYEEWDNLYPEFAQVAADEGFAAISIKFLMIAAVERNHERRYRELYDAVKAKNLYHKKEAVEWRCEKCGHLHNGTEAPEVCPLCSQPQSYFEIENDKF